MLRTVQMEVIPGDLDANFRTIEREVTNARDVGASVVAFPEMAVPGYLVGDDWEQDDFLRECDDVNAEVAGLSKDGPSIVWGSVKPDWSTVGEDGRTRKYNAAFVASNGSLVSNGILDGFTAKTLMPKYREFDDERHFYSMLKLSVERGIPLDQLLQPFDLVIENVSRKVGIIICEDMWWKDYGINPAGILVRNGAEMILNLSASPYGIGKSARRDSYVAGLSEEVPFAYVNNVGPQNNGKNIFLFDGGTQFAKSGKTVRKTESFVSDILDIRSSELFGKGVVEQGGEMGGSAKSEMGTSVSDKPEWKASPIELPLDELRNVRTAIVQAIRSSMRQMGKSRLVIGLSGGVDSAVVAALAVEALGKENVFAINMPSRFNSTTTKNLAKDLASELGIEYREISIEESATYTRSQIEGILRDLRQLDQREADFNYENIQARDRWSRVLAAAAAQLGAVFTNNGNKTEVAQGFATLYGDVGGAFAPIADLYKSQVFALARMLVRERPEIGTLDRIASITPSAELSENQNVDEWKGDPFVFEYHDRLLYQFVEIRQTPTDILEAYLAGTLQEKLLLPLDASGAKRKSISEYFPDGEGFVRDLERIWKNLRLSFFKRVQSPPIVSVSKRAFGFDLRESQNGVRFGRRYESLKSQISTSA